MVTGVLVVAGIRFIVVGRSSTMQAAGSVRPKRAEEAERERERERVEKDEERRSMGFTM